MKYCRYCGSEIADEAVICLKCGCRAVNQQYVNPQYSQPEGIATDSEDTPAFAIASAICGITSFFFGWLVLGTVAIILAYLSKQETGGKMSSLAKTGYVCGWISIILSIVAIVLFIAFVASI